MAEIEDQRTLGEVWADAVRRHAERPFLVIPVNAARAYHPDGLTLSYGAASREIERLIEAYRRAGYGRGHRVAMLLENRPEHVLHRLALNIIGASCVPINPDHRPAEIAYLVDHAEPELILTLAARVDQISQTLGLCRLQPHVQAIDVGTSPPPAPRRAAASDLITPATESQILYTSGTTGRPKGCIISHGYEIASAAWYTRLPGRAHFRHGAERIYNPLPLYHINSGVVSLLGAVLIGGCQIQPDRFHPDRWWPEVIETQASVIHYLGVVIQMLAKREAAEQDRRHQVRFGFGAGVEPQLHAAFEARFGFPLIEVWGMTEMVRVIGDTVEPRQVGTRAFGRAVPGIDVRVADETDRDVADGTPGELLVRHSAETPRRGAFSGYLKDATETEIAWRGGWFHSGDTVTRSADGMLHFVDRKKNIIRRSGENIAAAEVEAVLLTHPEVLQTGVMAVHDEMREEEVLACIVLREGIGDRTTAERLFQHCSAQLAYYKAPGWIWFARELPTTGTQKIQKHAIFQSAGDPRTVAGMIDLRALKRRDR